MSVGNVLAVARPPATRREATDLERAPVGSKRHHGNRWRSCRIVGFGQFGSWLTYRSGANEFSSSTPSQMKFAM